MRSLHPTHLYEGAPATSRLWSLLPGCACISVCFLPVHPSAVGAPDGVLASLPHPSQQLAQLPAVVPFCVMTTCLVAWPDGCLVLHWYWCAASSWGFSVMRALLGTRCGSWFHTGAVMVVADHPIRRVVVRWWTPPSVILSKKQLNACMQQPLQLVCLNTVRPSSVFGSASLALVRGLKLAPPHATPGAPCGGCTASSRWLGSKRIPLGQLPGSGREGSSVISSNGCPSSGRSCGMSNPAVSIDVFHCSAGQGVAWLAIGQGFAQPRL